MRDILAVAKAPSNIALLKYMGKKDFGINLPENPSLSLTLDQLHTIVEISREDSRSALSRSGSEPGPSALIRWEPEMPKTASPKVSLPEVSLNVPRLGEKEIGRVIRHMEKVRREAPRILSRYGFESSKSNWGWILRSANTFPASSGIASSASSFAALTLAGIGALVSSPEDQERFKKGWEDNRQLRRDVARLSREGSGSSCRSFEGPWVLWKEENAALVEGNPDFDVAHFVLLLKTTPKKVSSSEAHQLIRTSPLWVGRPERVEKRAEAAVTALNRSDWMALVRLAWSDCWEMHSLFHTCQVPFSYWEPETMKVLQWFAPMIAGLPLDTPIVAPIVTPPIVTIDAGPNVHIIVKSEHRGIWFEILRKAFPETQILSDQQGLGATLL